jgi:hypothetical protein
MIESKLGELALDASGGRGNPYLRHSDPTNINHLWKLVKVDACYLLVPKVGEGELALDANVGKDNPYFRKFDATNNNELWELRKVGDYHMIVPLVRRTIGGAKQVTPPEWPLPKGTRILTSVPPVVVANPDTGALEIFEWARNPDTGKLETRKTSTDQAKQFYKKQLAEVNKEWVKWTTKDEARFEIEKILKRAEAAGGDRQLLLDEIEKTVKDMKEKAEGKK